ncbi:MAG: hypothetical protein Q9M26_08775 [Mariprofundales bacterium]|nr:hypothetical protein [Mariprofundales bacterium]
MVLNPPQLGRAMMRHIAGLEADARWRTEWQPKPASTIRYWFDCWPPPWMGLTVGEELAFGLHWQEERAQQVLAQWELSHLKRTQPTLALDHFDAVCLMLAHAELANCDLLLMEQPDAGLSIDQWQTFITMLKQWLARSQAIALITGHL